MSVVEFARLMGCSRTNVYKMLNRATLDTQTLMRASITLRHNFFAHLSLVAEARIIADTSPLSPNG